MDGARLTLALVALAPGAAGAEALGGMHALIGGEAHEWHTILTEKAGKPLSTATFRQGPVRADLMLQGHPEEDFTTHDVLSVDVVFPGIYEPGTEPQSVRMLYMPDSIGGPFWTTDGAPEPAQFEVISFDIWGNRGRIEAVFAAELCLDPRLSAKSDPENCRTLTGYVATDVVVE